MNVNTFSPVTIKAVVFMIELYVPFSTICEPYQRGYSIS
jgi:hypothetical protein